MHDTMVMLQEKFLTYTWVFYLLATPMYIIYLGKRSNAVGKIATALGLIGVTLNTLGLVFRWWAAGINHPPFTNLYESLVFFGWGIVVFYLYMEWRHGVKMAGAFVFPIALAAMMLAVTHQERGIMPLPDALKSWWLHIHVMFASIAYAAFVVAFAFSLMYLIKDRVRREVFGAVIAGIVAVVFMFLLMRQGASYFGLFAMKQVSIHGSEVLPVVIANPDTGAREYKYQIIQGVGPLFLGAFGALALSAILYFVRIYKENPALDKAAGGALGLATALITLGIVMIFANVGKMNNVSIKAEPFLIVLIFFLWLMAGGMVMLHYLNESITERLPDVAKLDFLSYRSVVVAFPLMTIVIVTGAVWAQSAWGRYWGWDPKETASLVTWFVYAIYLHSRVVAGWKGRPTAIISIIGFLSVIFTYLGVNVFLSGLHSYASSL